MFMLNLLFDFTNLDGSFSNLVTPGNPLQTSKRWLRIAPPDLGVVFDPEALPPGLNWDDFGPGGTLLIPSPGPPATRHVIVVRVAPVPAVGVPAAATLDFSAAFGRPAVARQQFSSPFEIAAGVARTLFLESMAVRPAGRVGWFFRLGRIEKQVIPPDPNVTHRYEFAVGVNVTSGGQIRSFGEDPEFDVGA